MEDVCCTPNIVTALIGIVFLVWLLRRWQRIRKLNKTRFAVTAVLGSGGHTKEMLAMLNLLDKKRYSPITFVVADSDQLSIQKAEHGFPSATIVKIPRAREVRQNWLSTVFTTLRASISSCRLFFIASTDLLICNGPGTCVPLCVSAYLANLLGFTRIRILFVESLCRVHSLSLSGKILKWVAHDVVVQWKELKELHPQAHYFGRLM